MASRVLAWCEHDLALVDQSVDRELGAVDVLHEHQGRERLDAA